jgi:hypothetical protein
MNKGTSMKEFKFHTYRTSDGQDCIIVIKAPDRDAAINEFNFIYGEHTPVDMIVEVLSFN